MFTPVNGKTQISLLGGVFSLLFCGVPKSIVKLGYVGFNDFKVQFWEPVPTKSKYELKRSSVNCGNVSVGAGVIIKILTLSLFSNKLLSNKSL